VQNCSKNTYNVPNRMNIILRLVKWSKSIYPVFYLASPLYTRYNTVIFNFNFFFEFFFLFVFFFGKKMPQIEPNWLSIWYFILDNIEAFLVTSIIRLLTFIYHVKTYFFYFLFFVVSCIVFVVGIPPELHFADIYANLSPSLHFMKLPHHNKFFRHSSSHQYSP